MPKKTGFVNIKDCSRYEAIYTAMETKVKALCQNELLFLREAEQDAPSVAVQWRNCRIEVVKTHKPESYMSWLRACTEANIMLHLRAEDAEGVCSVKLYQCELIGDDGNPLPEFEANELLDAVNPFKLAKRDRNDVDKRIKKGIQKIQAKAEKIILTMEYGVPLREFQNKQKSITEPKQKILMLFQSLEHLHCVGIVHEDIKGSNIALVKRANKVVPVFFDYDVSAFQNHTLIPYAAWNGCTDYYQSPEQAGDTVYEDLLLDAEGRLPLTQKTDVYSMAVIAFELMGTALPKDRSKREQFARAYAETSQVYAVLAEATEMYPDDRSTAQRVVEELTRHEPRNKQPDFETDGGRGIILRNTVSAILIAVVAIAGIIAGVKLFSMFLSGNTQSANVHDAVVLIDELPQREIRMIV